MSGKNLIAYLRMPSRDRLAEQVHPLLLKEGFSEGYRTGEYSIEGLQLDDLQRLADWMIGLPASQYDPLSEFHRALEKALIAEQERHR